MAESESDKAMAINGTAPGMLTEEAKKLGADIVHYSTGYGFNGNKDTPLTQDQTIVYMNIVSDTNIFLAVALGEPEKDHIIQLTSESTAMAPEILPYEIGNALTAMVTKGAGSFSPRGISMPLEGRRLG